MKTSPIEVFTMTLQVADALEALEIPYFVAGSVASGVLGVPRATRDSDLIADFPQEKVDRFVSFMAKDFYLSADAVRKAIRRLGSFNLIHFQNLLKVDIFISKGDPFSRSQLGRRVRKVLILEPERSAYFASAEDTVLSKLKWYREGGSTSDQQWKDVLGVLKVQADALDRTYLDRWARELDLFDLLARALHDAGLPPTA